jgi:NAD(P)-dependent dehydrogenase (short-subunit alcohol dehydrogenase family)
MSDHPNDKSLPRRALVVGGRGGIGRHIADRLSALGYEVLIAGRSEADDALTLRLDITDGPACRERLARLHREIGSLDCLVNCAVNAVGGVSGPFAGTDPNRYPEAARVSVAAMFELVHGAYPLLRERGGAIVLFGSDSARFASRNQSVVAATSAAISAFTRNFALEAAADRVRINCISLTYVRETPIYDGLVSLGSSRIARAEQRAGLGLPTPADVAPLAAFLCSDDAARITGQVISINGGLSA